MTNTQTAPKFRKGQKVIGLGRYDTSWQSHPTGTVTMRHGGWVRVQWDESCVEDDMRPEWLVHRLPSGDR